MSPADFPDFNQPWILRLYIAGDTPSAARAIVNLKRLVAEYLAGQAKIEIIDILREPDAEGAEDILAVPLLVRVSPPPLRRIVGDLANFPRVIETLQLPIAHAWTPEPGRGPLLA